MGMRTFAAFAGIGAMALALVAAIVRRRARRLLTSGGATSPPV
jgi:hypothetical protein